MASQDLNMTFFRGGDGPLQSGTAYFTSSKEMAAFYGEVQAYTLLLKSPKFVTPAEWTRFDSTMLRFDNSPIIELIEEGHDSAVVVMETPKGQMITVFAIDGKARSFRVSEPEYWNRELNTLEWDPVLKQGKMASCEACGKVEAYMHILNEDRENGALCDECWSNPDE